VRRVHCVCRVAHHRAGCPGLRSWVLAPRRSCGCTCLGFWQPSLCLEGSAYCATHTLSILRRSKHQVESCEPTPTTKPDPGAFKAAVNAAVLIQALNLNIKDPKRRRHWPRRRHKQRREAHKPVQGPRQPAIKTAYNPADFPNGRISRMLLRYPKTDWMMQVCPVLPFSSTCEFFVLSRQVLTVRVQSGCSLSDLVY
jgi:hypothetical protein